MRYYKDPNSETIARGVNTDVYSGWDDLGAHPEFDNEITTNLCVIDGELTLNQNAKTIQAIRNLEQAVQSMLDNKAREKYDSVLSCVSYIGDSNTQWDSEARAFQSWRSAVWAYCYQRQQAGGPVPTESELIADILLECPTPW